jgi:hypothetical protein
MRIKLSVALAVVACAMVLAAILKSPAEKRREQRREFKVEAFTPDTTPARPESIPSQVTARQELSLAAIEGQSEAETVALVRNMSAEQRKMLAFRLAQGPGNQGRIAAFFKAWGEIDSYAAFQASKDFKLLSQKEAALRAIFEGVRPDNAAQLVDLLTYLQPGDIPANLAQELLGLGVGKWAKLDPKGASDFLARSPGINLHVYMEVGGNWAASDPQAAIAWAEQQDGAYRRNIMLRVLQSWVETNPQDAMQFARQHASEGTVGASNASMVANALALSDPSAARAFAESLPLGEARNMAIIDAAMQLSHDDPAGTAKWVESLQWPQGAVAAVLTQYAVQDPADALQWIETLPPGTKDGALSAYAMSTRDSTDGMWTAFAIKDDPIRNFTIEQLRKRWLARDQAGFRNWVASSGLPPATQSALLGR